MEFSAILDTHVKMYLVVFFFSILRMIKYLGSNTGRPLLSQRGLLQLSKMSYTEYLQCVLIPLHL